MWGAGRLISAYHAKYYAHELTRRHAADGVDRLSQSLFEASVDLNPHQIEAALFALRNPLQEGVLLADEVGLARPLKPRSWSASSGQNAAAVYLSFVLRPCASKGRRRSKTSLRCRPRWSMRCPCASKLRATSLPPCSAWSARWSSSCPTSLPPSWKPSELRAVPGSGGYRRSAQAAQCAPNRQPHRPGA